MLKADSQQMRMEMIDGNERLVARQRKPLCKGHADKQGPKEPGTAGHRYDCLLYTSGPQDGKHRELPGIPQGDQGMGDGGCVRCASG